MNRMKNITGCLTTYAAALILLGFGLTADPSVGAVVAYPEEFRQIMDK